MLRLIPLAGLITAALSPSLAAAAQFEGAWNTVVSCDMAAGGAKGYVWRFAGDVKNGRYRGQYGTPGQASSGLLTGAIGADGGARFSMSGYTGAVDYSVGFVQPKTPFHFTANGHFDASHGSATRNELRPCTLDFTKM